MSTHTGTVRMGGGGEHRGPPHHPHRFSQNRGWGRTQEIPNLSTQVQSEWGGTQETPHLSSQVQSAWGRGWRTQETPHLPHRNSQNRALAENIGDPASTLTGTVGMGRGEHRRLRVYPTGTVGMGRGEHRRSGVYPHWNSWNRAGRTQAVLFSLVLFTSWLQGLQFRVWPS